MKYEEEQVKVVNVSRLYFIQSVSGTLFYQNFTVS